MYITEPVPKAMRRVIKLFSFLTRKHIERPSPWDRVWNVLKEVPYMVKGIKRGAASPCLRDESSTCVSHEAGEVVFTTMPLVATIPTATAPALIL